MSRENIVEEVPSNARQQKLASPCFLDLDAEARQ